MVRITGGILRGRVVTTAALPGVRPTTGRVREALFSMVGQDLSGRSVLDAFGGTGLLAFEAASRGGGPVTVVERERRVARAIGAAAAELGMPVEVRTADTTTFFREATQRGRRWGLVLLDPPYTDDAAQWATLAAPVTNWLLVVEHARGVVLPDELPGMVVDRRRTYGDCSLTLYSRVGAPTGVEEVQEVVEDAGVVEGEG